MISSKKSEEERYREKYDILVDIDFKPDVHKYSEQMADKMSFITKYLGVRFTELDVYETVKGYHFYFKATAKYPLNPIDIVVIQFTLGSDYKREVFNYRRARAWIEGEELSKGWNTLFKMKFRNGKLISYEDKTDSAKILSSKIMNIYEKKISKIRCGGE